MSKESALKLAGGSPIVVPTTTAPAAAPVATPVVEATAGATPPAETKDDRLSIIIKKEAKLFQEQEKIKKEREDWAKKQIEYDTVINRAKKFDEIAGKDKIAALKSLGWSDTDIVNAMNQEPTAANAVEEARRIAKEEADKIRAELSDKDKKSLAESNARLVTNFKKDLSDTLKKEADKFKFAAYEGKEAEIQAMKIIEENLRLTKGEELISIQEALEMTNDIYKAKYEGAKGLFEPAPVAEPVVDTPARGSMAGKPPVSSTPQPKPRTLTNAVTPTAASANTTTTRTETPGEKRQRLADALRAGGIRK